MPKISIVAAVYNEARESLAEFVRRLEEALHDLTPDWEVVLVDDGSANDAWETILALASSKARIKGVRLSRNFGQHMAITAGLDHADGDYVVVMDSDLQDQPENIPQLYAKARDGYDVVFVERQDRPESRLYLWVSGLYWKIFSFLAGQTVDRRRGNFSIVSAPVVHAIRRLREPSRFYGGMIAWVGFRQTTIVAVHGERFVGTSTYNLARRFKLGLSIITGFSTRLLYVAVVVGLVMSVISIAMACHVVYLALVVGTIPGWPSVMTAVFFAAGVTNLMIGLIGMYVAELVHAAKDRPLYIVREMTVGQVRSATSRNINHAKD